MNETVKNIAGDILKKITKPDVKTVKGIVGIVELTCDVVEEVSQRLKQAGYKLSGKEKKELAFLLIKDVVLKLRGLEILDDIKSDLILDQIEKSKESVDEIIDDVISIFNENRYVFTVARSCFKKSKKILRKFELI